MQTTKKMQDMASSGKEKEKDMASSTAPSLAFDADGDIAPSSIHTPRAPPHQEVSKLSQHKQKRSAVMPTQQLQEVGGPSSSKKKRSAVSNLHSTVKQVKSPTAKKDIHVKRVKSPTAKKRVRSPLAGMQVRTPVLTSSPMMRLLVSPVVVGARSPAQPSHHVQRSPSRSPPPQNIHDNTSNDITATSTKGSKPRRLRSAIWKDVEPIYESGKLIRGRCIHCNEIFPAARNSGTSHIKRHLDICEERAKVHNMIENLQSTGPTEAAALADWRFDAQRTRGELVRMIVLHELPFSFVEYDGFIRYSASLNPVFKLVGRTTIKMDCMEVFKNHRLALRDMLKDCNSRVSLTADAWTSKGNIGYFCITCHYIDDKWKVQKKIIRFCYIKTPHDASNLYNVMLKSIRYYNIEDKLFSVTLDNAAANTTMVNSLCEHLFTRQLLPSVDLFHVRCAAHVLNLIVKDGLQTLEGVIDNVRESVKYVKASQSRKEKFEEIIAELGISCKKRPSLDVPTRWNSTYLMLKSALPLRVAFHELKKQDLNYNNCPLPIEWDKAKVVCKLLKVFKRGTKVVSGSTYPTSNLYFHQIWKVREALEEGAFDTNATITSMVKEMQKKFDKYWKISYLPNCIPVVLDPRFKFGFVDFRLRQAFGDDADFHINRVDTALSDLFSAYSSPTEDTSDQQSGTSSRQDCLWSDWSHHLSVQRKQGTNELDRYLQDDLFPCDEDDFDILHWWKMHSPMYPTLARIACDLLAVPASTVPSESAFSTSSRVISDYRCSLSIDTVEALMCLQDWFHRIHTSCQVQIWMVMTRILTYEFLLFDRC
ncbi:unnamed protein product [Urochloa decumbens]|uniref:BED-type domain-containing protein n=1 Tax=Urochloa decumbens TaxID=240449 RepID=A0ABC9FKB6_9POAL